MIRDVGLLQQVLLWTVDMFHQQQDDGMRDEMTLSCCDPHLIRWHATHLVSAAQATQKDANMVL